MKPKVSIIIPVYNGSNYLGEAIDSALSQSYINLEVIVVNDGSDDDQQTRNIALSYGNRIRYFEKKNGGVSSALNLGIKEMKGDYFSWLSHDDIYYPQKIQREIELLESSGDYSKAVYSNYEILRMPERSVVPNYGIESRYLNRYVCSGIFAVTFGFINGCSLLIPRQFFKKYGLFDEQLRATQDYVKWFEMFKDNDLIYINNSLVQSRMHEKQVTWTYSGRESEEYALYKTIAESIQEKDLLRWDISLYEYYSMNLLDKMRREMTDVCDVLIKKLKATSQPTLARERGEKKRRQIIQRYPQGIYLYCMGKRGAILQDALYQRGFNIQGFIDSDENKWNTERNGIRCRSLKDVTKDALIVVTKKEPLDLIKDIHSKGYLNVIAYSEMEDMLWDIPVDNTVL